MPDLFVFAFLPVLFWFFFFKLNFYKIRCVWVLCLHVYVSQLAWCLQRPEEDARSPEAGVTDGGELPCEALGIKLESSGRAGLTRQPLLPDFPLIPSHIARTGLGFST